MLKSLTGLQTMSTSNVTIHLGLHKTATGTLQRQFFPACENLNLLTTRVPEMHEFVTYVTRTDPLYFDATQATALLNDKLRHDGPTILSNESLSGPPYAGVIEGGLDHRAPILQNLSSVFPNARAILVIRRQDNFARSLYRQYLKSGGTRPAKRFFATDNKQRPPLLSLDRFRFLPYVDAVAEAFGGGLLLLTFEEFAQSQDASLSRICEFIGTERPDIELKRENVTSLGPFGMEVSRYLNHLFRSHLNPAGIIPGLRTNKGGRERRIAPTQFLHDKWPGKKKPPSGQLASIAEQILKDVEDDNRALAEKYGLDLERYGYY